MGFVTKVAALLLIAFSQQGPPHAPVKGVPSGYVEINGAKSPVSIPDWLTWHDLFGLLARAASEEKSVVYLKLALSPEEKKVVVETALAQDARLRECDQRQLRLWDRFKDVERSRIVGMVQQDQLSCRKDILATKDMLLGRLSGPARSRLQHIADENRSTITAYVPRADLEHFRRPR